LAKIYDVDKNPPAEDLQEYITWVLSQEISENPVTDPTGERAARNQGRYKVWFIPGGIHNENKIARECTVPSNTEILILAATADSSYLEHKDAKSDDQLLNIAKATADIHKKVEITIGERDKEPEKFRDLKLIQKDAFPIIFPENNIYKILYGVKGGFTHLAVVGWGIKVKLQGGKYTLTLRAEHDAKDIKVPGLRSPVYAPRFNLDIEYQLTAVPEQPPQKPRTAIEGPPYRFANYAE
jgi:hypothetical protein